MALKMYSVKHMSDSTSLILSKRKQGKEGGSLYICSFNMYFFLHENTVYHLKLWPVDWRTAYSRKGSEGALIGINGIYITQTRKHDLIKSDSNLMLDVNCKTKPKI